MKKTIRAIVWLFLSLLAAFALAVIALNNGEPVNALWILVAAVCIYLIAYRYYSRFIANRILHIDADRMTPAYRHNDGLDYVPTNKYVLFGHHFAAIAGAGPLVGPVLAVQMGYLPGMLWIVIGAVFAGAVQDFIILFISVRRDGRSLGDLIKQELGSIAGLIALFGTFAIMIIILAVLSLIVVKALINSPWGTFTVCATIPIALMMGIYLRYIRPGRIGEVSIIGFTLLMLAIIYGGDIAKLEPFASYLTLGGIELCWLLIIYGAIASMMPVWLILAPRDYLSTFLKIGTIFGLAIGIVVTRPLLSMPALTQFAEQGNGPVWPGQLFPFLFITIACGAVSGFHALIASGTTPKMLENESQARFIGYGAMLMESFVAIMALIAASIIQPGIYFAMNSSVATLGGSDAYTVAEAINSWGFYLTPEMLNQQALEVGEQTIIARSGGAPTLAVGMARILSDALGGSALKAFWYHFAILFEALFILTAVDAGTRSGRFMLQDLLGHFFPLMKKTDSLIANFVATILCVSAWGYFLYQGVIDPYGGINSMWPLFGIANQMLATIALILATVILFKMKQQKYAWVAGVPALFILICTSVAGLEKIFHPDPAVGFLAMAGKCHTALQQGILLSPATSVLQMQQLVFNNQLNAGLTLFFLIIMYAILLLGILHAYLAYKDHFPSTHEAPYHPFSQPLGVNE